MPNNEINCQNYIFMPKARIGLATPSFSEKCSTTELLRHYVLQFFQQVGRFHRINIITYFADVFNARSQTLHQAKIFGEIRFYVIKSPERNANYERPLQNAEDVPEYPASVYLFQNLQAFFA